MARDHPGVRVFSLPRIDPKRRTGYEIELGVKGPPDTAEPALWLLREGAQALGGAIV